MLILYLGGQTKCLERVIGSIHIKIDRKCNMQISRKIKIKLDLLMEDKKVRLIKTR